MAEHISRPGGEFCKGLQPLMPIGIGLERPTRRLATVALATGERLSEMETMPVDGSSPCEPQLR
jgi:hypothetical protein